ncbi:acetyl-CoA acetyltransferase [Cupriavidus necator]|uniref:acetyl-CoA acetyltransferase n=1 Tax=Cupriavidus necator TaxID=106590 RepID=UPI003ED15B9A
MTISRIPSREAVIISVADAPLIDGMLATPASPVAAQALVAHAALRQAGLTVGDVDGLLTAGTWGVPGVGQMPTIALGEYLGIVPRFFDGTNIGGAAFESHVGHAAMAIESGQCDVALITYGSTQKSDRSRSLGGRPPALGMQFETPFGLPTPVGGYAMAAMRHMHEFGTTRDQLADIAVAARQWAALNPAATMRAPIQIKDVLDSPKISDPLHVLDACLVTDGAGALVMTTAEHAKALGVTPVYLRGFGEAHTHWSIASMPDVARLTSAERSGRDAFAMAGIGHDAIDLAMVYDSFTITVILTLEALGFCARGEGGAFAGSQRVGPGGVFPLNTNGGGLSFAHPGMYGLFLLIEAVRQLRGEAGARQIPGAQTAIVHGTGGTLSSGATCILSRS